MSAENSAASRHADLLQPTGKQYVRAVGPRLRILLYVVFALVAVIGANSVFLAAVTGLEWVSQRWGDGVTYQNHFYLSMFMLHLALGLLLVVPFLVFGTVHMLASRNRRNQRAVRIGYFLFGMGIVVLVTGILLVRIEGFFDLKQPAARSLVYWCHVIAPLSAMWLYWLHRLAGPRIKWRVGLAYGAVVGMIVLLMVIVQAQDPRQWYAVGPKEGAQYFEPSLARTGTGDFIPAKTMMMDDYCKKCHSDIYDGWFHSVHHISSFNNPAYLASVRETRQVALKRDGNLKAARWCAGCHDPVPFFSGAFDDPNYDDVNDPTAHAGITCTTCHAITNINSTRGNADYTIEEPLHYPFASSQNTLLQFINNTVVKAKPSFHKQTFLKPFHKTAEFCSTCHKVHLPKELTQYKEFLRGQNHYDPYLLSGVSGHGARSFYYPPQAQTNCNGCHMPLAASKDFGAKNFPGADQPSVHSHLFPSANTAMAWLRNEPDVIEAHRDFNEGVMRVDIFGIKEGGTIDGQLHAPLRPTVPALKPGGSYLLETVIRTLKMGHLFTQGTVDSNEIWLDVEVTSGKRVIGRSGGRDAASEVDPWSHFVNAYVLDKNGNRIDRRNAADIFVPLYNHQIPPGAAQVAHYALEVPRDVTKPITVKLKLNYRKFDKQFTDFMTRTAKPGDKPIRGHRVGQPYMNQLPMMVLAEDTMTFPISGIAEEVEAGDRGIPAWQRWNDYGIGLFLEGKAELRQAADAFAQVESLGQYHGPLNAARVLHREGRLDEAVGAIERAAKFNDPPAPPWTMAWLSGLVNREQGYLAEAATSFRSVLDTRVPDRDFDFSLDYQVINLLGMTLFDQANQQNGPDRRDVKDALLRQAVEQFEKTLRIDAENVTAHYNLALLYTRLDDQQRAAKHRRDHARYKSDDNAGDQAVTLARQKSAAADHAAESLVIYSLHRAGAPESGAPELPNAAVPRPNRERARLGHAPVGR
ncbi:MAG: multiheme c-type cytochrome [Pirellulaceae bacterium]|nr:multiheme c-type cytochrome [Pirellulaceae bacterium]